jgi:type III secretory pathway component EscS
MLPPDALWQAVVILLAAVIIATAIVAHGILVGHTPAATEARERIVERVIKIRHGRTDEPETPDIPIGL